MGTLMAFYGVLFGGIMAFIHLCADARRQRDAADERQARRIIDELYPFLTVAGDEKTIIIKEYDNE